MHGSGSSTRSIVHEVAHQWFYSLVGNDQGRDPWLDEGLASYVEFVELGSLDERLNEPIPSDVAGQAGQPMTFWEHHEASYYPGVYVQPGAAVARLGAVEQVDCALRQYVARNAFRIAVPADLFAALGSVFPDAADRLAPYGLHP
jgi:aminopeptidase N